MFLSNNYHATQPVVISFAIYIIQIRTITIVLTTLPLLGHQAFFSCFLIQECFTESSEVFVLLSMSRDILSCSCLSTVQLLLAVSTEDEIVLKYPNIEVTIIMPPDTRTNILLIDCFVLYGLSALCSLLKTKSIFRLQNTFQKIIMFVIEVLLINPQLGEKRLFLTFSKGICARMNLMNPDGMGTEISG